MVARSWRMAGLALVLLGAAALLPAGQMMLSELSSFEKHLGYSAVFLAPLAGRGLDKLSRGVSVFALPVALVGAMLLTAESNADNLTFWGDVEPVLEIIEAEPVPGLYLSVAATTLKDQTRDMDGIVWLETFDFFDTAEAEAEASQRRTRQAVSEETFARVVLRGDVTGNPAQDEAQEVLIDALTRSRTYTLEETVGGWRIFTRTDAAEASDGASSERAEDPADNYARQPVSPSTTSPERIGGIEVVDGDPSATAPPDPRGELYRDIGPGDRGPTVAEWQAFLQDRDERALPRHGVDGVFGRETTEWTERYLDSQRG
jgi:hypothetical protein